MQNAKNTTILDHWKEKLLGKDLVNLPKLTTPKKELQGNPLKSV